MRMTNSFLSVALAGSCLAALVGGADRAEALCVGGAPNGIVEAGEECDDKNLSNYDCCFTDCTAKCKKDNNPCTETVCTISSGKPKCSHKWIPSDQDAPDCEDGDLCTRDFCVSRRCTQEPRSCDDGNLCTADTCDPATGCLHTAANENLPCNDGNACTFQTRCIGGLCSGGICDEGMPCFPACQASCRFHPSGRCGCYAGPEWTGW